MELIKAIGLYFPGKVVFLDDDENFLSGLVLSMPASLHSQMETIPQNVMCAIKNQQSLMPTLLEAVDVTNIEEPIDNSYTVLIDRLKKVMFDKGNCAFIPVLIVDQSMPEMSGVELCERLSNSSVKKILLTGESDSAVAIKAFNNGVIDYFIEKNDPNLIEHLVAAIENLRQAYFQQYTSIIMSAVAIKPDSFLNSEFFLDIFTAFINEYEITKFCLIDLMGSFLGTNSDGKCYHFLVKNKKQIEELVDVIESSDEEEKILSDVIKKKKLIYFFNQQEQAAPISMWEDTAYPVDKEIGEYVIAVGQNNI